MDRKPLISEAEEQFIKQIVENKSKRIDGRNLFEGRTITIQRFDQQVQVQLGATKVCSRILTDIVKPKNRGNRGSILFNNDLNEENRHLEREIEKLQEKIIKGSKVISLESLSIINHACVWKLTIENQLVKNEGNLIDAFYLATLASLIVFRKAFVKIQNKKVYVNDLKNVEKQKLSINHIPITFTFGIFNKSICVYDPLLIEEQAMQGRLSITTNVFKEICNIHKPGGVPVDFSVIEKLMQVSVDKLEQVIQVLRQFEQQEREIELKCRHQMELE